MRDYRTARVLNLIAVLEGYRPHPSGRSALVEWITQELDAGPSDPDDAGPGDATEQSIIEKYPSYLDQIS